MANVIYDVSVVFPLLVTTEYCEFCSPGMCSLTNNI